jgi:hypothetical protein
VIGRIANQSIQHDCTVIVDGDGLVVLLSDLAALGDLFGLGFSSVQLSVISSTLGSCTSRKFLSVGRASVSRRRRCGRGRGLLGNSLKIGNKGERLGRGSCRLIEIPGK